MAARRVAALARMIGLTSLAPLFARAPAALNVGAAHRASSSVAGAAASPKALLDAAFAESPVVMVSRTTCGYCSRAKALLQRESVPFKAFDVDQLASGDALRSYVVSTYGHRTVPAIFMHGKLLGGSDSLSALASSTKGGLRAAVEAAKPAAAS